MIVLSKRYIASMGWILVVTGAAKLYSAAGSVKVLDIPEGLFPMSNRQTLLVVGAIELLISLYLLLGKSRCVKLTSIAWLGMNFALYRIASMLLVIGKPCPCLGSITQWLPIKPVVVNYILVSIVIYMIVGSGLFLMFPSGPGRCGEALEPS
jgi:hypothetical protein